jgi:hypothetical protein
VIGIAEMKPPSIPEIKSIGAKARIVVNVPAAEALPILSTASLTISWRDLSSSR